MPQGVTSLCLPGEQVVHHPLEVQGYHAADSGLRGGGAARPATLLHRFLAKPAKQASRTVKRERCSAGIWSQSKLLRVSRHTLARAKEQ